jgi:glycosyltransferase involved in cell wall biosynthesis
LKVLVTIPCLLQGGTEMQTFSLVYALKNVGYQVTTLCYFEYEESVVKQYKYDGSDVILLKWKRIISPVRFVIQLRKEIRRLAPDAVHIQYMAPGALPILAACLASVKTIIATVHQPYTFSHGRFARILLKSAQKFCTCFIAVSLNAEISWFGSGQLFNENLPLKAQPKHFTIYNAVDLEKIRKVRQNTDSAYERKELNIPENALIIGAVSRLRYEKGIDLLITAFGQIASQVPQLYLLIVGTGPDEEKLRKMTGETGFSSRIIFCGGVGWEAAMRQMALMDLVVVPSRFEGFGLTAAEALAMGKPVITTNVGGLPEVIDYGKQGILVDPEKPEAIASILIDFANKNIQKKFLPIDSDRIEYPFSLTSYQTKIRSLYGMLDETGK